MAKLTHSSLNIQISLMYLNMTTATERTVISQMQRRNVFHTAHVVLQLQRQESMQKNLTVHQSPVMDAPAAIKNKAGIQLYMHTNA